MTELMKKILEGKEASRRELAALPFEEKIALVKKMRDRDLLIAANSPWRQPASATQPAMKLDRAWRKSRIAARLLIRKERGPLRPRDQALARQLGRDSEVSNRLIQQGLYCLGIGPRKREFDRNLFAIKPHQLEAQS
jgi:hypothetical protein